MNKLNRLLLLLLLATTPFATTRAAEAITIRDLTVKLIDQRDVPARETGLLIDVSVQEGDSVTKGQIVARMDDRQVRLEQDLANTQVAIAKKRSDNFYASELAEKDLARQREMVEQQKLLSDVAHRKAGNRVRVFAAQKAEAVAKNELSRATNARAEFADSVSRSELDGLNLAHQRMQLESQQAEFDRQMDSLTAESEDRASRIQAISVERSLVAVKQATVDKDVAKLQSTASMHSAKLAALSVMRHQVISPINGIVVQRYKQPGEWVKLGDPIVRIVHLKRLRAEGFVSMKVVKQLRKQKQVTLTTQNEDETLTRIGTVGFISPEIDTVNKEVAFWVEFDNADGEILPGMQLSLTTESQ